VLEHLSNPRDAIMEMSRVLKKNGKLFLTTSLIEGQHEKPYDYFRFTSFGLKYLFNDCKFDVRFIRPKGGYFACIGKRLRPLPYFLFKSKVLRLPITLLFEGLIPLVCFYLDKLDKDKDMTIGYCCYCVKE